MSLQVDVDFTIGSWKGKLMYICKHCAGTVETRYSCLHLSMLEQHLRDWHKIGAVESSTRVLDVPLYDAKGNLVKTL